MLLAGFVSFVDPFALVVIDGSFVLFVHVILCFENRLLDCLLGYARILAAVRWSYDSLFMTIASPLGLVLADVRGCLQRIWRRQPVYTDVSMYT